MSKSNKGIFVIGALVTAIGLALYPVAVHPKLFPQNYRKFSHIREPNPLGRNAPYCVGVSAQAIW